MYAIRSYYAHHLGGEQPGLAGIDDAIGDVEQDHQRGAESGDRNLGGIADTEQLV